MARVRQYVYFAIRSETMSVDQITELLGREPDSVLVRGSERSEPPIPRVNAWKLCCDGPGLTIDEQIEAVLSQMKPLKERIAAITAMQDCTAVLQLVRNFDDDDGEPEQFPGRSDGLQKLSGRHQLLGWHLRADDLSFLGSLGVPIDADEYG